jgi:hypothetical protein
MFKADADPLATGVPMADYRLYLLDRQGRISRAVPLDCETDDQAVDQVHAFPHDQGKELWQRDRLVDRFVPGRPSPGPGIRPDRSPETLISDRDRIRG